MGKVHMSNAQLDLFRVTSDAGKLNKNANRREEHFNTIFSWSIKQTFSESIYLRRRGCCQ